jgi:hypothetical protein
MTNGKGAININVLWEMGGAQRILHGVLERTRGMVAGVTCGAGMPYKLSEITASYGVTTCRSSARPRLQRLWKRAYSKFAIILRRSSTRIPGSPAAITASQCRGPAAAAGSLSARQGAARHDAAGRHLRRCPIVMAGGVWNLKEWEHWIDNPSSARSLPVRHRPLLTQEARFRRMEAAADDAGGGDVLLHRFSPTGFYSSAVRHRSCVVWRRGRSGRSPSPRSRSAIMSSSSTSGSATRRTIGSRAGDLLHAREWFAQGFTDALKTPGRHARLRHPEEKQIIRKDQADCMGCLSQCAFSSWADNEKNSTGRLADPRSFCIQKTLRTSPMAALSTTT